MYKLYNFVQRTVNSFCFVIFLLEMAVADDGHGLGFWLPIFLSSFHSLNPPPMP